MAVWTQVMVEYQSLISTIVTLLLTVGLTFLFYPAILVYRLGPLEQHTTSELRYQNSTGSSEKKTKDAPVLFSIVIPAYNEEFRLTTMLAEAYAYLSQSSCPGLQHLQSAYKTQQQKSGDNTKVLIEWIVVNDGSKDKTCQVYCDYVQSLAESDIKNKNIGFVWKLISLAHNSGKGAAVKVGMMEATGYFRLMVDADGATTFGAGLEAVAQRMQSQQSKQKQKGPIVFGSRTSQDRTLLRSILQNVFLRLRYFVVGTPADLHDTQCGFKLFDPTGVQLFSSLNLRRWAFDIELVYVAVSLGIPIQEVKVPWHEVDGSKLNTGLVALAMVSIGMLRDMCCVRACYVLGIWKIHKLS